MNILMLASEATPLIKVGGLADVVGALPAALAGTGHDVRILLPRYGALVEHGFVDRPTGLRVDIPWLGKVVPVEVYEGALPGTATPLYTLQADAFFVGGAYISDSSPSGYQAQMQRFTFFAWAAAHVLPKLAWQPDVVHCHDWHTAGFPVFSRLVHPSTYPTVVTIHNIESQGKWGAPELFSWLGITGDELPSFVVRDPQGDFNLLQQGVLTADAVTTVSPTYAQEILQPEYGLGLEKTIQELQAPVTGIVNGIDVERFNPKTDHTIAWQYSAETVVEGKNKNRDVLAKEFGWSDDSRPVLGMVSRLTAQKGVDILADALPTWVRNGGRVIILGTGQPELERRLQGLAEQSSGAIVVKIGFDAAKAQQIYAGADFFAMPSKFEPCGLGQPIAMRYGTLPIVRDTGGLHDTVTDVDAAPDRGTGFVFRDFAAAPLSSTFERALRLWQKPDILTAVRQRAMRLDFSWAASAAAYLRVYANIKKQP